jgi:glycosyltransferase involved in cell wall biosynthesis
MRLLFLAVAPPLPANNGLTMRAWSLLRALAAEGHQVELLTFTSPHDTAPHSHQLSEVCHSVEFVPRDVGRWASSANYADHLSNLFASIPYGVTRYHSLFMAERIAQRLKENFNAVIAASLFAAVNLPEKLETPLIVDENDVEHVILERYLHEQHNPLLRAYAWLEARKMRYWERIVGARSSVVMLCSENDCAIMRRTCPKAPLAMVPNTIDVETYRAVAPPGKARVLYLAGMDWLPNQDASKFFIEEILPSLKRAVPRVKFVIAFSPEHAPPRRFREQFATVSGVEFSETNNVRGEFAQASVLVVPLRIGSGTRFKILEASAMAIPVVSTRVGAEGLNLRNGKEIVLEDDPEKFARATAALLADSSMCAALGLSARARVQQHYGFDVLRATLSDVLARVNAGFGVAQSANFNEELLPIPDSPQHGGCSL